MFDLVEYSFENLLYLYTQFTEAGIPEDGEKLALVALAYIPFMLACSCVFEVVKAFFSFCCSMCKSRGKS